MFCHQCGFNIDKGDKFCGNCGTALKDEPGAVDVIHRYHSSIRVASKKHRMAKESKALESTNDESEEIITGETHPWRRYFAKMADLWLSIIFLYLFSYIFWKLFYNWFPETAVKLSFDYFYATDRSVFESLSIFTLVVTVIIIETLFIAITGTTPSKWLFGITLTKKGNENITVYQSFKRTIMSLFYGCLFWIPVGATIMNFLSYRRLKEVGATYWDEKLNFVVKHKKIGTGRKIVCSIFFITLFQVIFQINRSL
jgi:hypothetical protein